MTNLEYVESKLKADQDEYEREKRRDENRQMAEEMHDIYQSFVDAGFSDEQAWAIFQGMAAVAIQSI